MSPLRKTIKFISQRLLPHLFIILAIILITLLILNGYNPTMGFMEYEVTEAGLYVLGFAALINGILTIIIDRLEHRDKKREEQRKLDEAALQETVQETKQETAQDIDRKAIKKRQ